MEPNREALVLGATGGIGGAIATALQRRGWHIRALARDPEIARKRNADRIEWITGDAMRAEDVIAAAKGVSLIVHAVNPPNYANWDQLVLPMIDNTIAAARAAGGARIMLPGTIYNFDPASTPVIGTDSPQQPKSRKGAIRVALEQRLEQAAPDVPSLILRAGDFFGLGAKASWFSGAMVTPGKPVRRILNPARAGHAWAYLPDLAEAFAQLADMPERLQPFERLQFQGIYDETGKQMAEAARRVAGGRPGIYRFPWWLIRLLAPFAAFPREAAEIAPHWRHPVRLDNSRLVELIGAEPHTPLDTAVRAALVDMGCLPDTASAPARSLSPRAL